ncbi:MAG: hypothetical protein H6779_00220 [Candidatus Nomurabacteria bacterium]|nr:MAG: hypothetical protein H6779_00220 [Candidatus Nomurabacteria bacterium]
MEILILITLIIQSMGVSLGVGSSTLAVLNFFTAIKDGVIDEKERNFMGVTYIVLRVSMVVLLITTAILIYAGFSQYGTDYFNGYVLSQILIIAILYLNAILMTLHMMPSTFGPAIQASAWYSLGLIFALTAAGLVNLPILTYILIYLTLFIVALIIINGVMGYLKKQSAPQQQT